MLPISLLKREWINFISIELFTYSLMKFLLNYIRDYLEYLTIFIHPLSSVIFIFKAACVVNIKLGFTD